MPVKLALAFLLSLPLFGQFTPPSGVGGGSPAGSATTAVQCWASASTFGVCVAGILGTDNSVAGTIQLANGSANAHTVWGSGATTTNNINGFATAPTTGHLLDCTVVSVTCLLHDSGVVTANVVNATSPGVGIAHFAGSTQTATSSAVNLAGGANEITGNLPVANLNSGTSASGSTFWRGDGTWAAAGAASNTGCPATTTTVAGWVCLEAHTAAALSTALNFTTCFQSPFDEYKLELINLIPVSAQIGIQFSTDGGSTYDTGNNYSWGAVGQTNIGGSNVAAAMLWNGAISATANTPGYDGTLTIFTPANTSLYRAISGGLAINVNTAGLFGLIYDAQWQNTSAAATAFRFFVGSGTFSGTVRCYGVQH